MRKKLTVFGLLVVGLTAAVVWFYCGAVPDIGVGLSVKDVLGIRRAIRQATSEPILRIHGEGVGMASVQTGRVGNGLHGSGHFYYLNETANGWQIVRRENWMSALPNKPDAANPAIASRPHAGRHRRGIADPGR